MESIVVLNMSPLYVYSELNHKACYPLDESSLDVHESAVWNGQRITEYILCKRKEIIIVNKCFFFCLQEAYI